MINSLQPIVTRIAYAKDPTASKVAVLKEMAKRCGKVRTETWHRYGSIAGLSRNSRDIRDEDWMRGAKLGLTTGLPARIWKSSLQDSIDDIGAYREAAVKQSARSVHKRYKRNIVEKKQLILKLYRGSWATDFYLRRLMRKNFRHGKTRVDNQIVLDSQSYRHFTHNGNGWIEITSLIPRKRLAIPLKTKDPITGTIRIILRDDQVEVHYQVEAENKPCGDRTLALDKGYSEVFTDQNGRRYGKNLGKILTEASDRRCQRGKRRSKIRAVRDKVLINNPAKAKRIEENNLGTKKLHRTNKRDRSTIKTEVRTAINTVVSRAKEIVVEDLSKPIQSKSKGRVWNRRLASWAKGEIQTGLEEVSQRSGASLVEVNASYTSQMHSRCGCLGQRKSNVFHCTLCGVVEDADRNAAGSILKRKDDPEIGRWSPYQEVKLILEERTRLRRTKLHLQDSSCNFKKPSTESESINTRSAVIRGHTFWGSV